MTIKVGDRLPDVTFAVMTDEGPQPKSTGDLFNGKKSVLFGVPGAFTPTCHKNHLPGYLTHLDALKAKGVDMVAVVAVNDPFVMKAWAEATGGTGKITFLSDGSAVFAQAAGLALDLTARGLGIRNQRFSMIVEDGVVKALNIEEAPGTVDKTGADTLLKQL
ncbi:MAG TPA: peroxiredoxin [Beijerinckiaceae bacterium]|nr:peroxiredoxin [Beijerinckiaceae bacterium]